MAQKLSFSPNLATRESGRPMFLSHILAASSSSVYTVA